MEKILKLYDIGQTLGSGAFSEVKLATDKKTGQKYAIKIIDKSKCAGKEGMILTEVNILKKVKHENIIALIDMHETDSRIFLVMELVTGGELFDSIVERGHYDEHETAVLVERMLNAADYLHDMGIAHRDLKPENLMFSDKSKNAKIMIGDFGLSKIFNDEEVMKTACGTPGYVAPEVLKRQGYGCEVDLWSIGVITYILMVGYPPFYEENNVELFGVIMRGEYEFDSPHWDHASLEVKDFISKLLVVDPKKRMTAKSALQHPFIVKHTAKKEQAGSKVNKTPSLDVSLESSEYDSDTDETANAPNRQATAINFSELEKKTTELHLGEEKQVAIEKPSQIKFLSLNIFIRPPLMKTNHSDYKDLRLQIFIDNILDKYDVIALQEMYGTGSSRQKKLINAAKKAGLEYCLRSPVQGLLNGTIDGGLLILSKYPIIKSDRMTLEKGINNDRFTSKGIIYACIELDQKKRLHLFNTHLQSSNSLIFDPQDASVVKREKQLQQLFEFIVASSPEVVNRQESLLLVGDFNINGRQSKAKGQDSEEYIKMLNILRSGEVEKTTLNKLDLQDVLKSKYKEHPITFGDSGEPSVISSTPRQPESLLTQKEAIGSCQSIDYLFWQEGKQGLKLDEQETRIEMFATKDSQEFSQLSDHYGISAKISLK